MDIMKSLVESTRTAPSEGIRAEEHSGPRDKLILTKLSEHEDIEAYLTTFERLMTIYKVEEMRWAVKLAPQLTGRVQQAYAAMSVEAAGDYAQVKQAILRRYDISEETYRQRFRGAKKKEGEAYVELSTRVHDLAKK